VNSQKKNDNVNRAMCIEGNMYQYRFQFSLRSLSVRLFWGFRSGAVGASFLGVLDRLTGSLVPDVSTGLMGH
jgi:hypothetical protein